MKKIIKLLSVSLVFSLIFTSIAQSATVLFPAQGGTGASTLTGVLIGNGTSAFTATPLGAGQSIRRNAGNTAYEAFTAGAGDVVGPASSTDNSLASFNSTTGKLLKDSGITYHNLKNFTGTGIKSGFTISINVDTTKIDIASGKGYIVDNSSPDAPVFTEITYAGATAITLTNLATNIITYLAVNSSGAVIQQTTPFTSIQRRSLLLIGAAIHSNLTVVNAVNNLPDVVLDGIAQFNDLLDSLRNFNVTGNVFSANGANLNINKSAGSIFKKGSNFENSNLNPHVLTTGALTAPATLRYRLQNGTEYANTAVIDPANYDLAGVLTAVPTNKWTVQRLTLFSSNLVRIQYGQAYYNSQAEAIQSIPTEVFVTETNIADNGLLRGFLAVKQGATVLNATTSAKFLEPDKFGSVQGVASGSGTTTLQQAYDNGSEPEVLTSTTRGAVSIKRGSAADTDNILEGLNGAGATTFSVTGAGVVAGSSAVIPLVIGGTGTTSDLTLQTTSGVGTTGADMHFLVGNNGGTEAMTVLNSGYVGVGTTAPEGKLTSVATTDVFTFLGERYTNDALGTGFGGRKARGTQASPTAAQTDDPLLNIGGAGYTSAGAFSGSTGMYQVRAAENYTATNQGAYLAMSTTPIGSTVRAERVRITDSGNVGIGTTPTAVLHLKAGTATASTAPLKFNSGALLTAAEAGAVEFLTDAYYGTITTGGVRKTFAFLESPSFTTPTLGVASATSINKVALTAPATGSTLTIADGKTLTASNTLTFTGTDASSVAFGTGGTVLYSGGALGTPSSATLTNATGLPVAGITASTVTALGVGSIELGHATDTTLSRVSAGVAAIEGVRVITSAGVTANTILKNNGTTFVASTETYAAPGTTGNVMTSDGTNWTSAAPSGGGSTITATAGENLTAGNAVFIGDGSTAVDRITFNTAGTFQDNVYGGTGTEQSQGQKFTGVNGTITQIKIYLAKQNSPTDNTIVGIQADSAGSPSGTYLGSGSIANTSLTASNAEYTITLSPSVTLTAGTIYHVVVTRDGARDTTNVPYVVYEIADSYSGGNKEQNSSGTWTQETGSELRAILVGTYPSGEAFKASASIAGTSSAFVGFAVSTVSAGASETITTSGSATLSGLTVGKQYYLSNTAGAISTSAGTVTRKVGISTSATNLVITNIW